MRFIELDNLPHQSRVPEILLHFEIFVNNGNIICTSATISKKGPDCVQYILSFKKHRNFIRTASELTKTLLAYKNNKFFIQFLKNILIINSVLDVMDYLVPLSPICDQQSWAPACLFSLSLFASPLRFLENLVR
jgi:hypothetical protein